ncbi:hypothetical protein QE410_001116 [Microbacterium sp. SORGH_AS 1204]|nr:hypothetical protein [Microbacterium sp. SORGH_AS_1204]
MGTDGLPCDTEVSCNLGYVAHFLVVSDQVIYLGSAELASSTTPLRNGSCSAGLRCLRRQLCRTADVAMFGVGMQQVHHTGFPVIQSLHNGAPRGAVVRFGEAHLAQRNALRRSELRSLSRTACGAVSMFRRLVRLDIAGSLVLSPRPAPR